MDGELYANRTALGPARLFQPDVLAKAQYWGLQISDRLEPEKALMLVILDDAFAVYQKNVFSKSKDGIEKFREEEAWFLDENDHDLFSFNNVCEFLGLNPSYTRMKVINWKAGQLNALSDRREHPRRPS